MNEAIGMQAEIIKQIAPDIVKRSIEGGMQWLAVWQVVAIIAAIVAIGAIATTVVLIYRHNHQKDEDGTIKKLHGYEKEDVLDHCGLLAVSVIAAFVLAMSLTGIASCVNGINYCTNSPTEYVLRHEFKSFD